MRLLVLNRNTAELAVLYWYEDIRVCSGIGNHNGLEFELCMAYQSIDDVYTEWIVLGDL